MSKLECFTQADILDYPDKCIKWSPLNIWGGSWSYFQLYDR